MIHHFSEPQTDLRNQSYQTLRDHFIAGRIGEWTFRASLQILRLPPIDISAEVHLAKMEMRSHSRASQGTETT